MLKTIDIEDGLQAALNAQGIRACAPPVPPDLGAELPIVLVTRTGGQQQNIVQDSHTVSVDCYAPTWAEAQAHASALTAAIRALQGARVGGVPCYQANINVLPYNNQDPDHPTVPRVTFSATLLTRVAHE